VLRKTDPRDPAAKKTKALPWVQTGLQEKKVAKGSRPRPEIGGGSSAKTGTSENRMKGESERIQKNPSQGVTLSGGEGREKNRRQVGNYREEHRT